MPESRIVKPQVNRREFISAAAAAGTVTLAGCAFVPDKRQRIAHVYGKASRIGISDAAYNKAWSRAATIVAKMTPSEKVSQTGNRAPAIKRLSLSAYNYYSGEALHGLERDGPVTSFPQPLAMVCSWNPVLALQVYSAVSDEARAYNKKENAGLSFYSPQTLNLHRDPRWGRCEEAPGEDPHLAGKWAVQVIRGMQGDDPTYLKTTASAKHFICNNTDDDRTSVSATVNARNFWEYYTRAFRSCAIDADVFTFMSSYNAVNGIPSSANRFLLTSLLRDRWGFRGYVTSDCDAIHNIFDPHHYVPTLHQAAALAIQAGCDLDCGDTLPKHLGKAIQEELVSETDLSLAVTRLLTVRMLLGEFDPPERVAYNTISMEVVDSQAHRDLALQAARQSIVLLKNDRHFLPLDKSKLKSVAVIGPTAGSCHLGGYSGSPLVRISPYVGIARALGATVYQPDAPVWPEKVHLTMHSFPQSWPNIRWAGKGSWIEYQEQDFTGKTRITFCVASPATGAVIDIHIDSLNGPRIAQVKVPRTATMWEQPKTISAPIRHTTGKHKIFFKFGGKDRAVCNATWCQLQPVSTAPMPPLQPGEPMVVYKPGCAIDGPKDEGMFNEAVEAAKNADMVIMVCGVNSSVDRESHDRKGIQLTGVQHELIKACFEVNPQTILVISSNNTVAVNWEQENLPAIMGALFAGQSQGTAIADVLFGDYNPGGKTCCTWYKSLEQLPPFHDYDIMKGRTYMYFKGEPLYPFGHGLSYTSFQYSDLKVSKAVLATGESLEISTLITNTGQHAGAEVAQLYVQVPKSPVPRPIKQLVGFQRLELKPGESRHVTFSLPHTEQVLWYWHEGQRKFVLEPGTLKLMIGSSSADIHLNSVVKLTA